MAANKACNSRSSPIAATAIAAIMAIAAIL